MRPTPDLVREFQARQTNERIAAMLRAQKPKWYERVPALLLLIVLLSVIYLVASVGVKP